MFSRIGILLGIAFIFAVPFHVQAAVIMVKTAADSVVPTQDSQCSLREAIENANSNFASNPDCPAGQPSPIVDEIRFSLGSDLVIDLVDELLLITDAVLIDGTTQDGTVCALDQRQLRVEINGANSNGQGLHFTNGSEGSHVRGLVLYNFFEPVVIQSSDIQVTCNNIGVNAAGDAVFGAPPGSSVGISLHDSSNITIGGTADGQGNVIAGYERQIRIDNDQTHDVTIAGNRIGVNAAGDAVIENLNALNGIFIAHTKNITVGPGNVVAGYSEPVVFLHMTDSVIQGNRIGVNAAGDAVFGAPPGSSVGISLHDSSNITIGGTADGQGNVIAGYERQIRIDNDQTHDVTIAGNRIGVNAAGDAVIENLNALNGIFIAHTKNITVGPGNVVAGYSEPVVFLHMTDSVIQGNRIGVGANDEALGNSDHGIYVDNSSNILIGAITVSLRNVIAHNEGAGIAVDGDSQNVTIAPNYIFDNGQLGIDLKADGVTLNDPGDSDAGTNGLLNYPEIISVEVSSNSFLITFKVDVNTSVTNKFRADFYANPSGPDPSNHGEGKIYLTSMSNVTASSGVIYQVGAGNPPGINLNDIQFVSSTLTEILPNGTMGATSEFSKNLPMTITGFDFGDAPDPVNGTSPGNYNTRQADVGASHVLDESVYLGWCVDGDSGDGQNPQATFDDITPGIKFGSCTTEGDDEDAIQFLNPIVSGQSVTIKFKTTGSGYFNGWIDWNQDGDWLDKYENIFQGIYLTEGIHTLTFAAPAVPQMATYARFRYFKENLGYGNFRPVGHSQGGEVEDYQVKVYQQSPESKSIKWTPTKSKGRR